MANSFTSTSTNHRSTGHAMVSPQDPFRQISAISTGSSNAISVSIPDTISQNQVRNTGSNAMLPIQTENTSTSTSPSDLKGHQALVLRQHRNFTAAIGFISATLLVIGLSTRSQLELIGFLADGSEDFGMVAGLWHVKREGTPVQTVCGPIPNKSNNSGFCDRINAVRVLYVLAAIFGFLASTACLVLPPKVGADVPAAVPAVLGVSALLAFIGWAIWQYSGWNVNSTASYRHAREIRTRIVRMLVQNVVFIWVTYKAIPCNCEVKQSDVQDDFESLLKAEFFAPDASIDRVYTRLSYSWALTVWAWVWPSVFVVVRLLSPTLDTEDFTLTTVKFPSRGLATFQFNRVHPAPQEGS